MKRRNFISLLGGAALAWPLAARAEEAERVRRVAVILPYPENDPQSQARTAIFRAALKERGWVEGRNVQLDLRWDASNLERIQKHVTQPRNRTLCTRSNASSSRSSRRGD